MTPVVLEDLLAPGLRLVVCGSAAGAASARAGAYYAGPQNAFWRTMLDIGLTPRQLAPAEFRELTRFGIGLTDIVKDQSGSDRSLRPAAGDAELLRARISAAQPLVLCFNGKRAAQQFFSCDRVAYGRARETIGVTRLFVAPSTSAAARAFWDVSLWHQLARVVRGVAGS